MVKVMRVDLAAVAYCHAGTREYFTAHGLDWVTFIREGLPLEAFANCQNDPMAQRLIRAALSRNG